MFNGGTKLSRMRKFCGPGVLLLVIAGNAFAQDDDAAALGLADKTPDTPVVSRAWRMYLEGALEQVDMQFGAPSARERRATVDLQVDKTAAPGWRLVLADRLDAGDVQTLSGETTSTQINTLKEAYVSWAAQAGMLFDVGRVNPRLGVATGYNPTDEFRDGAVRSVDSIDPASLRENRLGSVMLRGQTLWNGGSLTALVSPKLDDHPNFAGYNPDFGATNRQWRWMLVGSEQLSENLTPQVLIRGDRGATPQIGLNLTSLLNEATVAYLEWSGGRTPSLAAQAALSAADEAYRSRLAGGLTYTFANKLSLTGEYEYSGAGMNVQQWQSLQHGPLFAYVGYREFAFNAQDLPTCRAAFLYAAWQDAGFRNLDLKGLAKIDLIDHSRMVWMEARYHWAHLDVALQRQVNTGTMLSDFGALPQARVWLALLRYYL